MATRNKPVQTKSIDPIIFYQLITYPVPKDKYLKTLASDYNYLNRNLYVKYIELREKYVQIRKPNDRQSKVEDEIAPYILQKQGLFIDEEEGKRTVHIYNIKANIPYEFIEFIRNGNDEGTSKVNPRPNNSGYSITLKIHNFKQNIQFYLFLLKGNLFESIEINIPSLSDTTVLESIYCNNLTISFKESNSTITISNSIIANKLIIKGYKSLSSLDIKRSNLHELEINSDSASINLESTNVDSLYLKTHKGNISLKDIEPLNEKIKSFIKNHFKFNPPIKNEEPKKIQSIVFDDFYPPKFTAKNIRFEKYDKIEFKKSIDFSNFKPVNSIIPTKKVKGDSKILYELFNTLYSISKTKNDKETEVEYRKGAMQFLLKSTEEQGRLKNLSTWLSLMTSKCYSNFGTNWGRSVGVIIVYSLITFGIVTVASSYYIDYEYISLNKGWNFIGNVLAAFLQILNPLHKPEFMDQVFIDANAFTKDDTIKYLILSNKLWFALLDFTSRIIVSIGIFETVRSFRKYV